MNEKIDILEHMVNRSSVRDYIPEKPIPVEHQQRIVQAAQMSSTSYNLQTYSIISIEDAEKRKMIAELSGKQWFICDASLFWIFCVDLHKMDYVTDRAGYKYFQSQFLESTLMGAIDTALVAQTASIEAEMLGYGICMIGGVRNHIDRLVEILNLPEKVFPLIGLCIGYPKRKNPPKPRLSLNGIFMKDQYEKAEVEASIDNYDEMMFESGVYEGRCFPVDDVEIIRKPVKERYGWVQHSGRRASTHNAEKARTDLRQILLNQKLGLD
jgi:nitroreductase